MHRIVLLVATVALLLLGTTAVLAGDLPPGGTFIDDDGNFHEGNIEAIAAIGITNGCNPPSNNGFCPGDDVSRGEVAAFLVRALGLTDNGGTDWFIDDDGQWYEEDVNRLATAGITNGCNPPANDRFCPEDPTSRGEIAAFLVRAYGYTDPGAGNWFTDDDGRWFEGDVDRLRFAGVTNGCNPPDNDLYCPDENVKRDQMATFLARAEGLTPHVPPPRDQPIIETIATGLARPVFLTSPPGDARQFVLEKVGRVRVLKNDVLQSAPFLDVGTLVSSGNEQGLLGMAFHPNYGTNGRFYISYTDTSGNSRIVEYAVSSDPDVADPSSARAIITVNQPAGNHNGGMIAFDPSGQLLLGLGDGGGSGDPWQNGENPLTLPGSILRIGVDGDDFPADTARNYTIPANNPFTNSAAGLDEIWAYGLRNPWRFSVDPDSGFLYIADVGQNRREEVNVAGVTVPGVFYGWNRLEGSLCFDPATGCTSVGTTLPELEYNTADGCAITGGYVYRGSEFPQLVGHYFYADYCVGVLRSFLFVNGSATSNRIWDTEYGSLGNITSFGVDASNRMYILTDGGQVLRLAHI